VEPQTLPQRSSARSSEHHSSTVDAFNLDLLDAYDDEAEEHNDQSPAATILPPRTSSLFQSPPLRSRLSVKSQFRTDTTDQQPLPVRKPSRQHRPHPIIVPILETVTDDPPQVQSARLPSAPSFLDTDPLQPPFRKRHRRHMTISESKRAARNTVIVSHPSGMSREHDLPPIPDLSPSSSIATSALSPVPGTPALIYTPPSEDRIRRELEMLTLQDGADPLLTHRYGGRIDSNFVMQLERQTDADIDPTSPYYRPYRLRPERTQSDVEYRSQLRRRKSFVEYFGRRSPVDKLLDLYLDDDRTPEGPKVPDIINDSPEKQQPKRKQIARRMTMTFRSSPKGRTPEVPPLPPQLPAGMT